MKKYVNLAFWSGILAICIATAVLLRIMAPSHPMCYLFFYVALVECAVGIIVVLQEVAELVR